MITDKLNTELTKLLTYWKLGTKKLFSSHIGYYVKVWYKIHKVTTILHCNLIKNLRNITGKEVFPPGPRRKAVDCAQINTNAFCWIVRIDIYVYGRKKRSPVAAQLPLENIMMDFLWTNKKPSPALGQIDWL